jgi:hypothetical protein
MPRSISAFVLSETASASASRSLGNVPRHVLAGTVMIDQLLRVRKVTRVLGRLAERHITKNRRQIEIVQEVIACRFSD